jgi:hypothetical protein
MLNTEVQEAILILSRVLHPANSLLKKVSICYSERGCNIVVHNVNFIRFFLNNMEIFKKLVPLGSYLRVIECLQVYVIKYFINSFF